MSATVTSPAPERTRAQRRRTGLRPGGLLLALGVLAFACLLSLAVGARSIPFGDVISALVNGGGGQDVAVVRDLRVPRTILGLLVGGALGVAGAMMQALTRNPLADPGLLGINMGASAAVVIGLAFGIGGATGSIWLAFVGAGVAGTIVSVVGMSGPGGSTPVRVALAGMAVSAALTAVTYGIAISDQRLLQQFNHWAVGALGGRGREQIVDALPFIVAGLLIAALLARSLNALALGEDTARALGARVVRTRLGCGLCIILLCGAATSAAGPMAFIGLAVPLAARSICGPDQRWILAYSAVLGGALMLIADVLGRVLLRPSEIEAGVMLAVIGAPIFILLVRRHRIAEL